MAAKIFQIQLTTIADCTCLTFALFSFTLQMQSVQICEADGVEASVSGIRRTMMVA
jgi:hypothetical protein